MSAMQNLTDKLDHIAKQIAKLENEANLIVMQGDNEGFKQRMTEKAKILADLSDNCKELLPDLPQAMRQKASARLAAFSESAATSLEIGSVFYMSALLYPDEHKKGEPNNLELFIAELNGSGDK